LTPVIELMVLTVSTYPHSNEAIKPYIKKLSEVYGNKDNGKILPSGFGYK